MYSPYAFNSALIGSQTPESYIKELQLLATELATCANVVLEDQRQAKFRLLESEIVGFEHLEALKPTLEALVVHLNRRSVLQLILDDLALHFEYLCTDATAASTITHIHFLDHVYVPPTLNIDSTSSSNASAAQSLRAQFRMLEHALKFILDLFHQLYPDKYPVTAYQWTLAVLALVGASVTSLNSVHLRSVKIFNDTAAIVTAKYADLCEFLKLYDAVPSKARTHM